MGESFLHGRIHLHCGDCRDVLAELPVNSIDACVTDPPYHLTSIVQRFGEMGPNDKKLTMGRINPYQRTAGGFMNKKWDGGGIAFDPATWRAVWRVLKPGAYLVAMGGTRTYHRLACAIEDAGFDVRDMIAWTYGSGFPKSHDISKGIDRAAGIERRSDYEPNNLNAVYGNGMGGGTTTRIDPPATDAARQWEGWGTALKPSHEPVIVGFKPPTISEHLSIVIAETTARVVQWLGFDANDAANPLNAIRVKSLAAANSVLASAKIISLASIGIAPSAVLAFTFSEQDCAALTRTKGAFVLSLARPNGSKVRDSDQLTCSGEAADILIRILDMSSCGVMTDATSASIVSSWLEISDVILKHMSTFTIETALRLTTALRTLNLSMWAIISADIGNLSPELSPICLARKPLSEGTIATNVLRWGTGGLNIDGCRIESGEDLTRECLGLASANNDGWRRPWMDDAKKQKFGSTVGRWPANVVHDGSEEVLGVFPDLGATSGQQTKGARRGDGMFGQIPDGGHFGDSGSAARFFYTAKADADDRLGSKHPTVKPLDLMQWLVRLVTPPRGLVLDPFAGTGTTGEAAWREGMSAVLIEAEAEYQADIRRRMALALSGTDERARESIKAKNLPRDDGPLFAWER